MTTNDTNSQSGEVSPQQMGENFSTAGTTSAPFTGVDIDHSARIVFAVIGGAMILSAVSGNWILVATIFKRFKPNSCMHNLFIANLALADMLTLGYWFSFFVLDLILGHHPVLNMTHCVANGMIVAILSFVTITSLLSITLNRYLHVCHSHLYSRVFTLPRTAGWCVAIWLCGTLFSLPPLCGGPAGTYHYNARAHICSFDRDGVTYPKVIVLVFSSAPLLIIAYCNFAIFRFWRKAHMSWTIRYPIAQQKVKPQTKRKLFSRRRAGQDGEKNDADEIDDVEDSADPASDPTSQRKEREDHEKDQSSTSVVHGDVHFNDPDLAGVTPDASSECRYETNTSASVATEDAVSDTDGDCPDDSKPPDGEAELSSTEDAEVCPTEEVNSQESETNCAEAEDRTAADGAHKLHEPATAKRKSLFPTFFRANPTGDSHQPTRMDSPAQPPSPIAPPPPDTEYKQRPSPSKRWKLQQLQQQQQHRLALQKRAKKSKAREVAFVRSLVVVSLLMLMAFVPYGIIVVIDSTMETPAEAVIFGNLMLFLNNAVNCIVYGAMNPTFRRGYVKCLKNVLRLCCPARTSRSVWYVNASLSSLMTTSLQRFNASEIGAEQSCASGDPTITED